VSTIARLGGRTVSYTVYTQDFVAPYDVLDGAHATVYGGVLDVVRGVITIRRPLATAQWWRYLLEMSGLALQTVSYLRGGGPFGLSRNGDLRVTPLFQALEPTEKGGASFRIGMGVAHNTAQSLLGIGPMSHIAPLLGTTVTLTADGRHPDLIGVSPPGNVHVLEAKARSNPPDSGVMDNAKDQVDNVHLVQNPAGAMAPPLTRIASVADLSQVPLHVEFHDPPIRRDRHSRREKDPGPYRELAVDRDRLVTSYYEPIQFVERERGGLSEELPGVPAGVGVRGGRLPGTDIWLGLDAAIYEDLANEEGIAERVMMRREDWEQRREPAEMSERVSTGPDGWVVALGDSFFERPADEAAGHPA
jgi:hypothetical protein